LQGLGLQQKFSVPAMSHLNFNIRAVDAKSRARSKAFNPRSRVSFNASSALWTVFAVVAVAGATFTIVWFA
jgi:hypothetical protein